MSFTCIQWVPCDDAKNDSESHNMSSGLIVKADQDEFKLWPLHCQSLQDCHIPECVSNYMAKAQCQRPRKQTKWSQQWPREV